MKVFVKRTINLFIVLLLATYSNSSGFAQPNESNDIAHERYSNKPIFSSFEIDTTISQTIYCGKQNTDKIVLLASNGSVLTSTTFGLTWEIIDELIFKTGKTRIDSINDDMGVVRKIVQSNQNKNVLFFIGTKDINWITQDCGKTVTAFNQGRPIEDLFFHPIDPNWIIATAFTTEEDESEATYKELFYSTNGGYSWKFLLDFVEQVAWGATSYELVEYGIPKQRVIVTRYQNTMPTKDTLKELDLVFSDDFFMTPFIGLKNVDKFILANRSLYVAKFEKKNDINNLVLMYAPMTHYTYQFKPAVFNSKPDLIHNSYSFLKLDDTVILNVNHYSEAGLVGDVYIANKYSDFFSHSLEHNVKQEINHELDFLHVSGMDGVFISNIIEEITDKSINATDHINEQKKKFTNSLNDYHNTKENYNVMTKITFNQGITWHKLKAPKVDSKGSVYECVAKKEKCYLNLSGITSDKHNIVSKRKAIGLILANGNVGTKLNNGKENDLFMSRDGGFSWTEIIKGEHVFNIGDHGGIIVIAPKHSVTNTIQYSLDEGLNFSETKITIDPINITEIEVVDDSLKFIVYGIENNQKKSVVVSIDFERVFTRKCVGAEYANSEASDYELWSPHDDSSSVIGVECLLGMKNTYVRRKPYRKCFNGLDYDLKIKSDTCKCKESDYMCDLGYKKDGNHGACEKIFEHPSVNTKDKNGCIKLASRGYKKIPGNKCTGGVNLDPVKRDCPDNSQFFDNNVGLFGILIVISIALIIIFNYISKFLRNDDSRIIRNYDANHKTKGYSSLEMENKDLNESRHRIHKNDLNNTTYHSDSNESD